MKIITSLQHLYNRHKRIRFEWIRWWYGFPLISETPPYISLAVSEHALLPPLDLHQTLQVSAKRVWDYLRTIEPNKLPTAYRPFIQRAVIACAQSSKLHFLWAEDDPTFGVQELDGQRFYEGAILIGHIGLRGISYINLEPTRDKGRKRGYAVHQNHLENIILRYLMGVEHSKHPATNPSKWAKIVEVADYCFPHPYQFLTNQETRAFFASVQRKA